MIMNTSNLEEYLRYFIDDKTPIAHIWYEQSINYGDAMIWKSQRDLLARLNANVVYECTYDGLNLDEMESKIGTNGIILMRGGGNFNHIYTYHNLRLTVLSRFKSNTIIQLPQSIHFDEKHPKYMLTKRILSEHNKFILLARDIDSLNYVKLHFPTTKTLLFPDITQSFNFDLEFRTYIPIKDIVIILRSDTEGNNVIKSDNGLSYNSSIEKSLNVCNKELITLQNGNSHYFLGNKELGLTDWYFKGNDVLSSKCSELSNNELANHYVDNAIKILQLGKVIITDRLHAFLLALYLGIPHVIIDNNNKKLSAYYKTWLQNSKITYYADNVTDGIRIARDLIYTLHDKAHQISTYTKMDRYPLIFQECKKYFDNRNSSIIKILSFGCSIGDECATLAKYFPYMNIYGTDINDHVLELCQKRFLNNDLMHFMPFEKLPRTGFDMITCMSVFCKWPDTKTSNDIYPFDKFEQSLIALDRLLNVDGLLIIYNANYKFEDTKIYRNYRPIHIGKITEEVTKYNKDRSISITSINNTCIYVKHSTNLLSYEQLPSWGRDLQLTADWFSSNIYTWDKLLETFKGKPDLKFLEIGCFEGLATIWLLRNILIDKTSQIYCIDTFEGSSKISNHLTTAEALNYDKFTGSYERFMNNIRSYIDKVIILKGYSNQILKNVTITDNKYDFIYIDASHRSRHVLEDAILAFPLLKLNGIMIFDDYLMGDINDLQNPKIGIDCFLKCYTGCYELLFMNYQIAIRKTSDE